MATNLVNPYLILMMLWTCFLVHFQALMMKKLRYKYNNKKITTCDSGNI